MCFLLCSLLFHGGKLQIVWPLSRVLFFFPYPGPNKVASKKEENFEITKD
jgi:hypothetical protein